MYFTRCISKDTTVLHECYISVLINKKHSNNLGMAAKGVRQVYELSL
ncbi:hypothetical protein M107_3085 [Bacteroides fragilis str. 3725 D9(v)]|uniref:Uncharacterized protein n=1 Tax=Bacteroides fragilis str. 3998T(B)3 TaxID=1339316 RepID=A0A015UY27_BACFG|nr:hypothetical protein M125_5440 [Bacteroides fragilis str. 3998T(B)3]EXZ62768.1 hypothetical protein M107_3085 [Bacteroides fragilis str. 3725 D9(v)]EYA95355.1 hypothetical protein M141_2765 [Bacteroides fragilis str. S38L5]